MDMPGNRHQCTNESDFNLTFTGSSQLYGPTESKYINIESSPNSICCAPEIATMKEKRHKVTCVMFEAEACKKTSYLSLRVMAPNIAPCTYMDIIILCLNLQLINSAPISYPKNSSVVFNVSNSIVFSKNPADHPNNTFHYNELICNPNLPCTVFCDFGRACKGATIVCPINQQCNIVCSEFQSCRDINIDTTENYNHSLLNLEAIGIGALDGFVYPPYSVDDNNAFELNCGTQFQLQCEGMIVICPAYANCTINC